MASNLPRFGVKKNVSVKGRGSLRGLVFTFGYEKTECGWRYSMTDEKGRDWVDTVSKLLVPIVIFAAGAWFSYQKDKSDAASQQFQRESEVLKLAASSNEAERTLGLKTIEILQNEGRFSKEMEPVVKAMSEGRPTDPATQKAQTIIAKQDQSSGNPTVPNKTPNTFLQISRDDQRPDAAELVGILQKAGFEVSGIELVSAATQNTYIRYFSADNKQYADKVQELMKGMGFDVAEQDFSAGSLHEKTPPGALEVWIGQKQGPLKKARSSGI